MSELALLSKPVLMRRLALAAIAAVAGLFYAWALGQDTLEYYYGAAVRSMSATASRALGASRRLSTDTSERAT